MCVAALGLPHLARASGRPLAGTVARVNRDVAGTGLGANTGSADGATAVAVADHVTGANALGVETTNLVAIAVLLVEEPGATRARIALSLAICEGAVQGLGVSVLRVGTAVGAVVGQRDLAVSAACEILGSEAVVIGAGAAASAPASPGTDLAVDRRAVGMVAVGVVAVVAVGVVTMPPAAATTAEPPNFSPLLGFGLQSGL